MKSAFLLAGSIVFVLLVPAVAQSPAASASAATSATAAASEDSTTPAMNVRYKGKPSPWNALQARMAAIKGQPCDLIFIGDSITDRWLAPGKAVWDKNYATRHALNFGVFADTTQNVLWRFDNVDLTGLHPKVAVILIGTNNTKDDPQQIADGVKAVIGRTKAAFPGVKIILVSIMPNQRAEDKMMATNAIIKNFADNQSVYWLDLVPLMWVLTPTLCTNVTIRNVTVDTQGKKARTPNTDGCDPDSCTDVLIEDCVFNTGDDCIAIKAGRNRDGRRLNVPCQNIIVRDCRFEAGHGGFTAGSETSGGIQNVFVENCSFDSKSLQMAFRLKTNPVRGGFIKNINIRDCTVKAAQIGIHVTMQYEDVSMGETIPDIRDIRVQNVKFETLTSAPLFVQGLSEKVKVSNVIIADCTFPKTNKQSEITFADNVLVVDTASLK